MSKISKQKLASGYQFTIAAFGARNEVKEEEVLAGKQIAEWIAKNGHTLATGAGYTGMMGVMNRAAFNAGGRVYGIGVQKYEPKPYEFLTDWEGYDSHHERQTRLIEIADMYVVMSGGLGTLMETLQVHIEQFFGEANGPLIIYGEFAQYYQSVIDYFDKKGLVHKLPSDIRYCKTANDVIREIESYIKKKKKENYFGKYYYPALGPEGIYKHLRKITEPHYVLFEDIKMKVLPGVYPSNRFRSSIIMGKMVAKLSKGKKVADICCGHGTMGLVAAMNGATHVVQSDINPMAVESARQNIEMHGLGKKIDLYEGDTFEPLAHRYQNYFDIIFWNPPFHRDADHKNDKLMYAFYTQGQEGGVLDKFLMKAKGYLAPKGYIVIGFSSKDKENNEFLKNTMTRYGYEWKTELVANKNTAADNIVYKAWVKKGVSEKIQVRPTIKLGMVLAGTGIAKNDGLAMRRGVELAIRDLKREGMKVDLGYLDDKSSYTGALNAINEIIEKFKPDAIVGPTWSYLIDVVSPVLEENEVPYLTPATSSDILASKGKLRISGAYINDTKEDILSDFLKENSGKNAVYILRENSWGTRHKELFESATASVGGTLNALTISSKSTKAEIQSITQKIKKAKPDVVVIDNYEDIFVQLLTEIKKSGLRTPIIATLDMSDAVEKDIKKLGLHNALYIIDAKVPEVFAEKFYHEYKGEKPHRYAYNAYMGTIMLAQAISEKGKKRLRDYITQDMKLGLFGETYTFTRDGDLRGSKWRLSKVDL